MYCSHGLPYEIRCSRCTAEAFMRERQRTEQSRAVLSPGRSRSSLPLDAKDTSTRRADITNQDSDHCLVST